MENMVQVSSNNDDQDISLSSNYKLKVILSVHLFLVSACGALQGDWCPGSVIICNALFFICILWAIHRSVQSDEPLQCVFLINVLSLFFDNIIRYHNCTLQLFPEFPCNFTFFRQLSLLLNGVNTIVRVVTSLYIWCKFIDYVCLQKSSEIVESDHNTIDHQEVETYYCPGTDHFENFYSSLTVIPDLKKTKDEDAESISATGDN